MSELLEPAIVPTADRSDRAAGDELFAALYDELHRLVRRELSRGGSHLSMGTTTMLHEIYLNVSHREGISFPDRERFLAYAAYAIRGFIIDASRRRRALKRGGGFVITHLETHHEEELADPDELTRIDEALEALAELDPSLAELVDLKYFCGLTLAEIGALRGVTERTMQREWQKAKVLLFGLLTDREARPLFALDPQK